MIKSTTSHQRTREFEEYYLPNIQTSLYVHEAHWRKVPAGWSYPPHAESMFEVNYVLEGVQTCKLKNRHHIMQAGDFIIIRPSEIHENVCTSESGLTYFCLHFDLNDILFRKMLWCTESTYFPKQSEKASDIRKCIEQLIQLCIEQNKDSLATRLDLLAVSISLFGAIGNYLSEYEKNHSPDTSIRNIQIAHLASEKIKMLASQSIFLHGPSMEPHFKNAISIIAKELGISNSYFYRIFSQTFGMSPRQYMSSLFLDNAKFLLLDSNKSIEEIASNLGYHDISHLSRQFKRWTGMTPSQYRNKKEELVIPSAEQRYIPMRIIGVDP